MELNMSEFERATIERWKAVLGTEDGRIVLGMIMSYGNVLAPRGPAKDGESSGYRSGVEDAARSVIHSVIAAGGWSAYALCMSEHNEFVDKYIDDTEAEDGE